MEEPEVQYQYGPGSEVAEIPPAECPRGHQLGPGRILVGHEPGLVSYRLYHCRVCLDEGVDSTMRYRMVPPKKDGPWE